MQRTYSYEEMLPAELQAAVKHMPVFFLPTGLLEWHGAHLPLGQDTLKSYALCLETAKRLEGGVVMPPHYWGRPGFSSYLGTMTFSDEMLRPLFLEIFEQIEKVGARVLLVLTGHYGPCQVAFLKDVADEYNKHSPDLRVIAQPEYEGVLVDGEEPCDHAGKWETSLFWYFYPQMTHMKNFKTGVEQVPQYDQPPHYHYGEEGRWEWAEDLTREASRSLGAKAADAICEHLKSVILAEMPTMQR